MYPDYPFNPKYLLRCEYILFTHKGMNNLIVNVIELSLKRLGFLYSTYQTCASRFSFCAHSVSSYTFFQVIAFTLIGVSTYAKSASVVANINLISWISVCGFFLILMSGLGFIGTRKHNQVLLFFVSMTSLFPVDPNKTSYQNHSSTWS